MSESDGVEPSAEDDVEEDLQMPIVILLEDCEILFDKRQTPVIEAAKEKAANSLAEAYTKNTEDVKKSTDLERAGNKKIVLTDWQKKCYTLWNNAEVQGENTVLNKAPGAVTAGYAVLFAS
ncbi:hypothetical protein JTB14_036121 [Gonioctena quinquepunctata]|nr:hypothetical protein JTB14_036121 [Gonioctena quinquepunctata]